MMSSPSRPYSLACAMATSSRWIASGYSARMYIMPFEAPRAVAVDGHGFDDGVGVAFEYRAVHESPRVAFVGIADDVFLVGLHLAGDFPFESRRETAAAAAAQSGVHNLADDLLRSHLKYLAQGGVTVAGDVFVDVLRVDEAAVAQGDADLGFIELHVLGVGDVSARVGGRHRAGAPPCVP